MANSDHFSAVAIDFVIEDFFSLNDYKASIFLLLRLFFSTIRISEFETIKVTIKVFTHQIRYRTKYYQET